MSNFLTETVTSVHHWNDTLFSFNTTRNAGLKFKNGQFTMIGIEVEGKPLMRAYSIASANHEEELEFFSIKVPDGPLTSRLQKIQPGDQLFIGKKPTGTLIHDNLLPGKHLYLLSTGTGLAPFLSIIKDPETYELYDKVILTHGTRYVNELAYQELFVSELPNNEYFGDLVREKLIYYPTVTREDFHTQGRLTELLTSGQIMDDIGLPPINIEDDRFMICGSMAMLKDLQKILEERGFKEGKNSGPGHFAVERAFVD